MKNQERACLFAMEIVIEIFYAQAPDTFLELNIAFFSR